MARLPLTRKAFTLVEILVVILIIGLLLALLFPAIQAARTASQSAGSANNLRQIGVSGLKFESRNRHFPPSWQRTKVPNGTDIRGWSIHALLLPYMEQQILTTNIDYTRNYSDANEVVLADGTIEKLSSMRVPTYVSPANPRDEVRFDDDGGVLRPEHYPVDYGVNLGVFFVWDPVTGEGGSGMAYPDSQIPASEVKDGLSYTMFFSEVKSWQAYYRNAAQDAGDLPLADLSTTGLAAQHVVDVNDGTTTLIDTLNAGAGGDLAFKTESGHTEWVDGRGHQIGFTAAFTPNTPILVEETVGGITQVYDVDWTNWQEGKGLNVDPPNDTPTYAVVTARSHFEGGVNVAMADGSVKWVANSVELPVWRAYATRAGEELIPPAKQW